MKKNSAIDFLIMELCILIVLFAGYIVIRFNDTPAPDYEQKSPAAAPDYEPAPAPAANPGAIIKTEPTIITEDAFITEDDLSKPVTITLAGDVLLDRGVKNLIYNGGYEAVLSALDMRPFIDADIAMINLEFPFSDRGTPLDKEYTFRGDPKHVSFLTEMGVDIVSLANNHALDYGTDAFLDTLDLLDGIGVRYIGAGRDLNDAKRYELYDIDGFTVAFVCASRVVPDYSWYAGDNAPGVFATYDPADLNGQITLAAAEADFVIVYVHWGVEKNDTPEAYQRELAKGYIDSGADAVIGSHPHVLQGFEFYKGRPIIYSLGNFIFTDAAKDSMAITLTVEKDAPAELKITPYRILNLKTSVVNDEDKSAALKRHLENISFDVTVDSNWVVKPAP